MAYRENLFFGQKSDFSTFFGQRRGGLIRKIGNFENPDFPGDPAKSTFSPKMTVLIQLEHPVKSFFGSMDCQSTLLVC